MGNLENGGDTDAFHYFVDAPLPDTMIPDGFDSDGDAAYYGAYGGESGAMYYTPVSDIYPTDVSPHITEAVNPDQEYLDKTCLALGFEDGQPTEDQLRHLWETAGGNQLVRLGVIELYRGHRVNEDLTNLPQDTRLALSWGGPFSAVTGEDLAEQARRDELLGDFVD